MVDKVTIEDLDPTILESRSHRIPAMKDGVTVFLTLDQILGLAEKADVGLGNANNTSDANKPISTAQGEALAKRVPVDASASFTAAEKAQAISNIGGGLLSGFRNLIINPLGNINQRAVAGTVILAAGNYGHDRFKAGASGCTYTFSTNNGVTTFNISAGSLMQVIEASCFAGRAGNYVLSWIGTAQGRVGSGSYGVSGAVSETCDGSANVTVEWTAGTVSLAQFEREFVTDFSARHDSQEKALCHWYFKRFDENNTAGYFSGYARSPSRGICAMVFPEMRDIPTYLSEPDVCRLVYRSISADTTSATLSGVGTRSGLLDFTVAGTPLTIGESLIAQIMLGKSINLDAEI